MMKIYILYLFLILYITPLIWFFYSSNLEKFANKKENEQTYILEKDSENSYSFKIKKQIITILPSNKSKKIFDIYFFYTSSPDKKIVENFNFYEINSQTYKLISGKNSYELSLSISSTPLKLNFNNFLKTFDFETAETGNSKEKETEILVYNIIYYKNPCGNLTINKKNNKIESITIKTINKDLKDSAEYLSAIFTGFLIFDRLNSVNQFEYDKFFKSQK